MAVFNKIPARWVICVVGFLFYGCTFALRVSMSIAMVSMVNRTAGYSVEEESTEMTCEHWNVTQDANTASQYEEGTFDWNEVIQGHILSAFYYGSVVTQIPGGRLAEMFGPKRVMGYCHLAASLLAFVIPAASKLHYGVLIFVRVVQGIVQGAVFPSSIPLISSWIPLNERSRVSALLYSGSMLGIVVSMWMSGTIIHYLGWESVFYVTGALSLLVWLLWQLLVYDTPEQHPFITSQEKEFINQALRDRKRKKEKHPVPWKAIWTSIPVWCAILCTVGNNWSLHGFNTALPTYMKHILRFNVKMNGFLTGLPYLGHWLFGWLLAAVADYIKYKDWMKDINIRKLFHVISFIIPGILMAVIGYTGCDPWIVIALLIIAVSCNGGMYSGYMVVYSFISPNFGGTTYGIANSFGAFPGFIAPVVYGALTNNQQTIQQWRKVFWITSCMYIITGVQFLIFGSTDVQPWDDPNWKKNKKKMEDADTEAKLTKC